MPLKGDVSSLSLLDLFQTLALTNKRGTLKVSDGRSAKVIYFGNEGVCLVSRGERRQAMLGLRMVQQGILTREELNAALREQEGTNYRLGEILTLQGKVEPKTLETVLRQQVEEEIFDLLTWSHASFEFREGEMEDSWFDGDDHRQLKLFFNVNDLLLEAARKADEWRRLEKILPDPETVLKKVVETDPGSPLWGRIDGQRTVRQVAEACGMSLLPAAQQMAVWVQEGLIKLPDREEGEGRGKEAGKDRGPPEEERAAEPSRKRRARRLTWLGLAGTGALFLAVAGGGVGWWVRSRLHSWREAEGRILELEKQGELEKGMNLYYQWSSRATDAWVIRLTGADQVPVRLRKQLEERRTRELGRLYSSWELRWQQWQADFAQGNWAEVWRRRDEVLAEIKKWQRDPEKGKGMTAAEEEWNAVMRDVEVYCREAERLAQRAEESWQAGDREGSYRWRRELHRRFPRAPASASCRMFLELISYPSGAQVQLGDKTVGRTPLWLEHLPWEEVPPLSFFRPGFDPLAVTVDFLRQEFSRVRVFLKKKTLWKRELGSPVTVNPLLLGREALFLVRRQGLTTVSLLQGNRGWTRTWWERPLSEFSGRLQEKNGRLYFSSQDGECCAVRLSDDPVLTWRHDTRRPVAQGMSVSEDGKRVVMVLAKGPMVVLDALTGALVRTIPYAKPLALPPAWWRTRILLVDATGGVECWDPELGRRWWRSNLAPLVPMAILARPDGFWLGTREGSICLLDLESGHLRQRLRVGRGMTVLPVQDEEQTYWVDHDLLMALRGSRVVWRRKMGMDVVSGLGMGTGSLFAVRQDGLLCAISRRAGVLLWRLSLGDGASSFCTVPQMLTGTVVVALGDRGTVWAIEE